MGADAGVSFSLPLLDGGGAEGGWRRRVADSGLEGGRRAPDAIRRMALER